MPLHCSVCFEVVLMSNRCTRMEQLTPIEKRGEMLFKRDDLYQPFDVPLNGGKVRQALACLTTNQAKIWEYCNNTVATVSSVHSPQGYLIARCAHSLGFHTIIGLGTKKTDIRKYPALVRAVEELGAEILPLAGIGYNAVLQSRLNALCRERHYFPLHFGIPFDLSKNANQVENLPRDLDNLVIPCGSGISAASIFMGLRMWEPCERPKRIVVVQIAGFDRRREINARTAYEFIEDTTYLYSRRLPCSYEGLELDDRYESKAFEWLVRNGLCGNNQKTLFWVIGNFNELRGPLHEGKAKGASRRAS
jgi:1-aminocyclopropane-1-carboxylate deaminase/D-cysteine desulfhydrase-like pyridoxal-dependent ACC family enzyme